MNFLFSPPSAADLIRLLKAWRFWVLGGFVGGLIGSTIYLVVPPPYQARATVLVDFNLEEAWLEETDRQQFYYLERETRKLEEIAWSDAVLNQVAPKVSVTELRDGRLALSQPAEGGWHFFAVDADAQIAAAIASSWANAFARHVEQTVAASQGLNAFIVVEVTQAENLPVVKSLPLSTYLVSGALGSLAICIFFVLFFAKSK